MRSLKTLHGHFDHNIDLASLKGLECLKVDHVV